MGPMHPWYFQELECLDFFWKAACYPDTLQGEVQTEVLGGLRLELGMPHNFTEANYKLLKPSTTATWVTPRWLSFQVFGITIEDDFEELKHQREGDCFLGPAFVKKYK